MKYLLKDKKINFYTPLEGEEENTKVYPYAEEIANSGGLWAHIRALQGTELFNQGMSIDKEVLIATLNYRTDITSDMKAEFNNKVYDVGLVDYYDFTKEAMKVTLTESVDNMEYAE